MDVETITWLWLICGLVLMVSEILVPGLVVLFLGISAVLVAVGRWFGLIDGILNSFTLWFVLSLTTILGLRGIISRFVAGNVSHKSLDEVQDAIGQLVEVIEEIASDHCDGRIRFRGSTWRAQTKRGRILPGQQAKIQGRKSMIWIVSPVENKNHLQTDSRVDKEAKKRPF